MVQTSLQASQTSSITSAQMMIDALLSKMTVEEKVGQLTFNAGEIIQTGANANPLNIKKIEHQIATGELTGLFNIFGADYTRKLQKIAVEQSRLKIPLMFGADVIHGFKTVTPIPLAQAASWDLQAIEAAERLAAREATAAGLHINFAPMVDIARDARWGRMAEGAGEDPYLGSAIARARVRGLQGNNLSDPSAMAACVKHFAAYGAALAGRDYASVDMSERMLRDVYLPPYHAAIEEGAAMVMTAFNDLNGIPASGNDFLLKQVLREEWGFQGAVVSDWQSIQEMISHGYSENRYEAGKVALEAGVDLDMMSDIYLKEIPSWIQLGKIKMEVLDQAVRRVLELKQRLGLFDDPYRYCDAKREEQELLSKENRAIALNVAKKSIVLLKNEANLLPLSKSIQSIAVIGPLADNTHEMFGSWSLFGEPKEAITLVQGIQDKVGAQVKVSSTNGCFFHQSSPSSLKKAIQLAQESDVVVLALGESAVMNGEGASRSDIGLPVEQYELAEKILALNKPTVVLLSSGRALAIESLSQKAPALIQIWALGTEAGNAVAQVLFGDYNPSGKLPVSFPRNVGQVPIFYSQKSTGRPYQGIYHEPPTERVYLSKYRDVKNTPLYPFGYGLSYTQFEYSKLQLSKAELPYSETLQVSVELANIGKVDGEEVAQLYIRDHYGSVTRPVRELKGFQKIMLKAGERRTIKFNIQSKDLAFYRADKTFRPEAGDFTVYVGSDSNATLQADFKLLPE